MVILIAAVLAAAAVSVGLGLALLPDRFGGLSPVVLSALVAALLLRLATRHG